MKLVKQTSLLLERLLNVQNRLKLISQVHVKYTDLSTELSNMKRSLLSFLNAVWATHDTVRNLKYGDSDMLTDDDDILEKFEVILATLDRQIQMAENVMEVISTGITVIQTESTNQLTKLIVWLTVLLLQFLYLIHLQQYLVFLDLNFHTCG